MIEIKRTYDPAQGLRDVEQLSGYVFSPESFAHRFTVEGPGGDVSPFLYVQHVYGRFLRADGVVVIITGAFSNDEYGWPQVTLPPECYAVPGRFLLTIYCEESNRYFCCYAATSTVLDAEGSSEIYGSSTSPESVQHMMAMQWRSINEMQGDVGDTLDYARSMMSTLNLYGLNPLNTPNLLSQEFWTTSTEDEQTVTKVYGAESRWYGSNRPYIVNPTNQDGNTDEITATRETVSPAISEPDGETYPYALRLTCVNAPEQGWGNAERLVFNHGDSWPALEVGKTYTLSCWVRLVSGSRAMIQFSVGEGGYAYNLAERLEITNTTWVRVHWTFTFNPTAEELLAYEVEVDGQTVTRYQRMWTRKVAFGLCRKYDCAVDFCGFRLVEGGLYKSSAESIEDEIAALTARVAALEAANGAAAAGNLSASAAASPLSGETGDQTENTEEVSTDAE